MDDDRSITLHLDKPHPSFHSQHYAERSIRDLGVVGLVINLEFLRSKAMLVRLLGKIYVPQHAAPPYSLNSRDPGEWENRTARGLGTFEVALALSSARARVRCDEPRFIQGSRFRSTSSSSVY